MPKQVDHEERRRHIAEAVLRLAAERELEAVSLRDVAAEAGVSMGMVQHYFTSKDRMLVFACQYLVKRARQRIQEQIAASPGPYTARYILRTVLLEILPLDEERRVGARVWIAFLARAVVEPELESIMLQTWINSHESITEQVRHCQDSGEIPAELDPQKEAASLLSVVDGLSSHVLIGHYSGEEALAIVDHHLDRLFRDTESG